MGSSELCSESRRARALNTTHPTLPLPVRTSGQGWNTWTDSHSYWLLYVPKPPWASCYLGVMKGSGAGAGSHHRKLHWNSGLQYQPQLAGTPSWTQCFYGKHVPVGDPPLTILHPPTPAPTFGVHKVTSLAWPPQASEPVPVAPGFTRHQRGATGVLAGSLKCCGGLR